MNQPSRAKSLTDRLTMATHNAEHVKLSAAQRQDVQNLNEVFGALARKSAAITDAALDWKLNAFGQATPNATDQQAFFDLHREFFDLTYSTLSALAACLNRLTKLVQGVRWSSNEKFLGWLRVELPDRTIGQSLDVLLSARNFRTIYTHPGQWKPFDWGTEGSGEYARVALHGTHPPLPPGVQRVEAVEEAWYFPSPNTLEVLAAFEAISIRFFGRIPSFYPPDHVRCTWEADGFGSAPMVAIERTVASLLGEVWYGDVETQSDLDSFLPPETESK